MYRPLIEEDTKAKTHQPNEMAWEVWWVIEEETIRVFRVYKTALSNIKEIIEEVFQKAPVCIAHYISKGSR